MIFLLGNLDGTAIALSSRGAILPLDGEVDTSDLGIVNSLRTVSFLSSRFYMADVLGISILYYIDTILVQLITSNFMFIQPTAPVAGHANHSISLLAGLLFHHMEGGHIIHI
jgi:hypothetical protein